MMTEDGVPSINPKIDAMCEMLKTIHNLNERNKTLEKQFTKAKEIIRLYLLCYGQKELPSKLQIEAEQFLEETRSL